MDGDDDSRAFPIAQPALANYNLERAGPARQRENKRYSGFEDLDWRDNEMRGLDFIDVDEEEDARVERARPRATTRVSQDNSTTVNVSEAAPETLEADTCRICSGPAEPGMPLYHPCKCSGTIRHVHQDCLKSWLDTSHRTRCDLCNHTFTYKKLYSTSMPSTLPARVVIGPMLKQVVKWALVFLRLILVGTVWLALLPALLHWCWRVGFWSSDYVSLRLSGQLSYLELYGARYINITDMISNASSSIMPSTSFSTDSSLPATTIFPTSLLQAISSAYPSHPPLSSAISSLQAVLQAKQQSQATDAPSATSNPNDIMMASAFSHIASILEKSRRNSRRSRFFRTRPRRVVPDEDIRAVTYKDLARHLTGEPLFEEGSFLAWEIIRLVYYLIYRTCGWIWFFASLILKHAYRVVHEYFKRTISNGALSTWQKIGQVIDELTTPIVTGQIIAVAIVIAFVLLFFLREWVMVNAEPGMFEDPQPAEVPVGNENGNAVIPQQANGDVPGAFPLDAPANPPAAAPRPAEWDRDVDLAEPRPPSPNIISLEEQEELMKEVIAWRKEQDKVISKSKAKVDEWQWEKKRVIIDDWKEQKMKAIKDKVAVEDGGMDSFERRPGSSTHAVHSFDKGSGKRIFEDDVEWERFEFDFVGNGVADVEHIEMLHRPTRKLPYSRRLEPLGDAPVASSSSSQPIQPLANGPPTPSPTTALNKSLANFEFSFSAPRSLGRSSSSLNVAPILLPSAEITFPATVFPLAVDLPSIPRSGLRSGSIEEPILVQDNPQESVPITDKASDMSTSAVALEIGYTEIPGESPAPDAPQEAEVPLVHTALVAAAAAAKVEPPTEPIVNSDPPAFSALVPPTPSVTTSKLPFSIRDLKVAPLERSASDIVPIPASSLVSSEISSSGSRVAHDRTSTSGLAPSSLPPSREDERGARGRQRRRKGARSLLQSQQPTENLAPAFHPPVTVKPSARNWNRGVMPTLLTDVAKSNEPSKLFISQPFVFPPATSGASSTPVGGASSSSDVTKKPGPISVSGFNIHAKPFQPGTMSLPITPIDLGAQRGHMDLAQAPMTASPASRPPGVAPFAYAPFEASPTNALVYGQAVPPYSGPFAPHVYGIPYSAPGPVHVSVRATFNAAGRPTHGHHMSMGMGMGTEPGRPAEDPVTLPLMTRGRALTTGTDTTVSQVPPSQPVNGSAPYSIQSQSHQRSSSLSSRSTNYRLDENHLLRPSSSSSGDSSTPSTTVSPMPWYGLPDPRDPVDRKKFEELGRQEEKKALAKTLNEARSKGKRTAHDLRIIESHVQKKDDKPADDNTSQPSSEKKAAPQTSGEKKVLDDIPTQPANVVRNDRKTASESQPAGAHSSDPVKAFALSSPLVGTEPVVTVAGLGEVKGGSIVKGADSVTALPLPSTGSSVDMPSQDSPAATHQLPSLKEVAQDNPPVSTVPLQPSPKVNTVTTSSHLTHQNRMQAPRSIPIPRFEPTSTEPITSPLKRPPLPSAASPVVIEERPSSKMALYQAPEEVWPQARQVNGQTVPPDDGFPPLMDYYFQPLGGGKPDVESKAEREFLVNDGSESIQSLPELEGHAPELPADNDFPDLVDIDAAPEDDAMIEGADAVANMANADDVVLPAPPPAEEVWDDEWTHLLEAVGMTGPWYSIVQNAALVVVIFNVTLGVGIFMPYILGRTTSLAVVDPPSVLSELAVSTDRPGFFGAKFPPLWRPREGASFSIVGKGLSLLFGDLVPALGYVTSAGQTVANSYLATIAWLPRFFGGHAVPENLVDVRPSMMYRLWFVIRPTSVISGVMSNIIYSIGWYQRTMPCRTDLPPSSSLVNVVRVIDHAICSFYPETLGDSPRDSRIFTRWVLALLQNVATDRSLAIVFGYFITVIALILHARISLQRNSYMVLMLFKVGCFVLFEAVIKPLLFGFMIDIFTLSLFSGASVQSRIAFWRSAPYSNLFHHWLVGNVVVVQFLYFLQDIQKSLRPGALLQIRKTLDPTTPSIRDMINKSIGWHALKYIMTLTSNLCLLWILLGLTIDINNLLTSNFAPLRWDLRRPLSDIPLDLVILHIFMPATFRFLKLKRMVRNMAKTFFTEWSRVLNLQSVLLGEALIDPVAGSYWRVPVAEDAVRLAGKPYAIQTDALGNGLTQSDKDMIDMQIIASRKGQRIPHNDYKVVFYPDWFILRLVVFLVVLWAAFFGAAWTAITLPIRIGRLTFKLLLDTTNVHDMYSWIIGLYLFWFASFAKYLVGREQRRWSKYLSTRTRSNFPVRLFVRHTATMLGRLALAVVWLIFLLPSLIGLLFEIYIVLPVAYQTYPDRTPTLRLMDAWIAGMIISAIILRAARLGQPDQLPELFERVRREGWFKIKARVLASELGPYTLGLAGLVVAPLILQYLLPAWVTDSYASGSAVLKVFLPALFFILVTSALVTTVHGLLYLWVEAIRDQRYLEKEIIQNMEDFSSNLQQHA